jgi:O-antigen ligase
MPPSDNTLTRTITRLSANIQSFFTLPMSCSIILFGYINYTAIGYYFGIQDSTAVLSYLTLAYGWAIMSAFSSRKIRITVFDIWLWILITIIACGYLVSSGICKELVFVLLLGVSYTIGRHTRYSQLPSLYKCILAVGIVALGISVPELPRFFSSWHEGSRRPEMYGTAAYGSAYGSSMAMLLITIIGRLVSGGRFKIMMGLLALILSLIILNSSARIAILSCAVSIGILFYFSPFMKPRKKILIGICCVALALAIIGLMPEGYKSFNSLEENDIISLLTSPLSSEDTLSLDSNAMDIETTNSVEVRIAIIRSCLNRFLQNPIVGYGPNRLIIPHNSFLQVLFEHGLFAGVVLGVILLKSIFLLVCLIKKTNKIARHYLCLLLSLFIYMLMYSSVMGATLTMAGIFLFTGIVISVVKDHGSVC